MKKTLRGYIGDWFGSNTTRTLAEVPVPAQLSIKETPSKEDLPMDMNELERAYMKDPICFNSINKHVQMIMAAGYEMVGEKQVVKRYIEFFEDIGDVGEDITIDEMFDSIYKYQMIYGNAYIELVFN